MNYELLEAIIKVLVLLLVYYVAPAVIKYLQEKQVYKYCEDAIRAAKQLYPDTPESNALKKAYAVTHVTSLCKRIGIHLTEDQVSSLIEAAYNVYKEAK